MLYTFYSDTGLNVEQLQNRYNNLPEGDLGAEISGWPFHDYCIIVVFKKL